VRKQFEDDPHLYLIHPRMKVVPDFEVREREVAQMNKTAGELTQ
jgi:hypothetical protein